MSIGTALVVDTVECPAATVTPSDDFTSKRIVCLICINLSVETTVVHIHICSVRMSYDTTGMRIIYIHLCRYPHTVDSEGGSTATSYANQSSRMDTTRDFALHVQISNSHIAYIAENRTGFTISAINVNRQRMAITIESTTIGGI